jgi:CspA family cold shock protein
MARGIVKWFHPTKGYVFIELKSGEKDVFVHVTAVQKAGLHAMSEGLAVSFDVENRGGRRSAVNLRAEG